MPRTNTSTKPRETQPADEATAAKVAPALPAYDIEVWAVEKIKANTRNARKHPKKQIEDLRNSFRKFGQVHPLLVREDGALIAGHGRFEAMRHEGFKDVRVVVARGWSDEQCRSFAILDNKIALNSEWDEDLLGMELKDLKLAGVNLGELGFDPKELEKLAPAPAVTNAAGEGPKAQTLKPVIQFNIVFDDEGQQQGWFAFVKRLKLQYPDDETLGLRLAKFIAALPPPVALVPDAKS
jgi:hypothetical protein